MSQINWRRVRYLIGEWFTYTHWRWLIQYRFGGMLHRAWYGWAPIDTWSFDSHLSRVIAGGLRHMSDPRLGTPSQLGVPVCFSDRHTSHAKACRAWGKWLRTTADAFERYEQGFPAPKGSRLSDVAETARYLKEHGRFHTVVLPEFVKYFPGLWI